MFISNKEDISIAGLGACTSVGISAPMSAASVRACISSINEHPYMIDKAGEPMIVSMASYIPENIAGVERFTALGLPAAEEALSGINPSVTKMPLIIALPSQRPGLPKNLGKEIALRFGKHYPFSEIETVCCGHSAGLMAMEKACHTISRGISEFCLVGGIDSYLEPETLEWLDYRETLHSESNMYGFIPGEAAGFCLLASHRAFSAYRLSALGKVAAVGGAIEKNLINTDTVCTGEGLTKAMRQVLSALPRDKKISRTICDLNGERYRADEYGFALSRLGEYFGNPADFTAPADCWGDTGAASGILYANLAIASGLRSYAEGPLALLWTSSDTGERSAAIIVIRNTKRI